MSVYLERQKMKNVTLALPNEMIKVVDKMADEGFYPSRSEIIRKAILPKLQKEKQFREQMRRYLNDTNHHM